MKPLEALVFALPIAIALLILWHLRRETARTAAMFRDFDSRWQPRARLVVEGRVWRQGEKRRAMIALGADRLALRAERTDEDIEVPLSYIRQTSVRETKSGSKLLDLSLPGELFLVEVAPGFLSELLAALARR